MARVIRKKTLIEESAPLQVEEVVARKRMGKPSPTVSVMGFLLFLALGAAGYFYYQYNHTPQVAETREIKALVMKVGKVVALPQDEVPTLATVTNKEKLDNQPFFQKAENGDKILIYSTAGQVVLYRPSISRVIDMTTVSVTKEAASEVVSMETPKTPEVLPVQPEPSPEVEVTPPVETPVVVPEETVAALLPVTVTLYNGSTKVGVTGTLETELKTKFPELAVTAKEKAVKNDYQGNLVIDLSLKNADLAKSLAESIGGTVGTFSESEVKPETDILIIVGNK